MFDRKRKIRKYLRTYGKGNVRNNSRHAPSRKNDNGTKKRVHPLVRKLRKVGAILSIVAIFLLFGYWIFFSDFFTIKEIATKDADLETQVIFEEVRESLTKSLGNNLLFIDESELEEKILSAFPQLETIKVKKDYPRTLTLEFQEYPLVANIINESPNLRKSYVINSIGFAIKEDYENPQLPYINLISDEPANPETPIITASNLKIIMDTIAYFEEKFGMKVSGVTYKPTPREIHLITEKGFAIYLDIQKSTEEQLKKLKKVLVKLDIYTQPLEYIDLRIAGNNGDKIIYKRL
jgi:cell division septal protein FtsQ